MAKLGKEPKLLIIGAVEYSDTITYFFKDKEIIIHTVNKPEKLADVFSKARPDIVIVDCVTPNVNGFALFRWLRLDSGLPPTPCLLITVSAKQQRLHDDEITAPTDFITTPIRQNELEEKLKALFKQKIVNAKMQEAGIQPPQIKNPAPASAPDQTGQGHVVLNPMAVGKKIMIVEDDQDHSNVLAEFLEREGYKVIQSNNLESFKLAVLNKPDLIVLDIRMPVLDGFALAEVFNACRLTKHIPIIFLSALHEARFVEASKGLKAAAYITKPVKGSNLLFTVGMVLRQEVPPPG